MKRILVITIIALSLTLSGCSFASKTQSFNSTLDFSDDLNFVDKEMYLASGLASSVCVVNTNLEYNNADNIMNAKAGLLYNVTDNEIVYSKHVLDKMYPASTTTSIFSSRSLSRSLSS